jgi:hypothetical protein
MMLLEQVLHTTKKHKNTRHFFTQEEDNILKSAMQTARPGNWEELAVLLPGIRPTQCRERWLNYLSPGIIRGNWTADEDEIIKKQVKEQGTKWAKISKLLPGRTENDIKNRWNTTLKKTMKETPQYDFWIEDEKASMNFSDLKSEFDIDSLSIDYYGFLH